MTDISVFRPSTNTWFIHPSGGAADYTVPNPNPCLATDKISPADYDGDRRTDIACYRSSTGTLFILRSSDGLIVSVSLTGSSSQDLRAPSDGDGDGRADLTVFRPAAGLNVRQNSGNRAIVSSAIFGQSGDFPTIGDFDGDAKGDSAVWRPSDGKWYRLNSNGGGYTPIQLGVVTDIPVPGDYDADFRTDLGIYRPSSSEWILRSSVNGSTSTYPFGRAMGRDIPAPGDYDGDGRIDLCVFRPEEGKWYRINSSNQLPVTFTFGTDGDIPTPSAYLYSPPNSISGTITYGNAIGAPTPRVVSNVLISGAGSPSVFTTTGFPGGVYALSGFGAGSYTVSLSKSTGENGITSNDAARVAQHVAGTNVIISNNQKVTADVTGNDAITSQDAAKIAQYVSGLALTPPNFAGQWRFYVSPGPTFPVGASPTTRTYSSVTSSLTSQDYVGLLLGDVTGNWTNSGAKPAGAVPGGQSPAVSKKNEIRRAPERGIAVEIPQVQAVVGQEFIIPVAIHGGSDKGIISYEFDLRYDPSVIEPQGDAIEVAGTASRGFSVVANVTAQGLLRVVVYGPMPIVAAEDNGVLLNLRFTALGRSGTISRLVWERLVFNEGEPSATAVDGQVFLSNK